MLVAVALSQFVRPLRAARAVVFDTDGVITDSARVHAAAWKQVFDAYLRSVGQNEMFDPVEDYRRHVDGRSRLDGAAGFLAARGLDTSDATVRAVAEAKERLFAQALREHGVVAYPGTVRLLRALRAERVPCAAVSASRHAPQLLERARVRDLFATVVDGTEAARLALPGKPDPALFLEAARRLGVAADRSAVIEDALAGVEAGRRGGFALVVGVDRTAGPTSAADLRARGADLVVGDLAELLVGEVADRA
ncbi:beta-phosphoglucomutase family hydrolase [Streptomyces griseoviridis]|uniref:Beta-phosphoglucomutase n=2 Tax=Streptomyces TaxID=1883 RepID=A0A3S9Z8G3_STRGD|nr:MULTISPECIES: beta-phosphoglucomutase family hydrolase [Streptomyces]AZS84081.1 beta-phosphoglucomutase family hydrolase [Streptomyces griseoviridis]MDT0476804.1 beta-phosphoglucomutase family hydrolase [Streptomyces sp. DSM 41014]QCN89064.1 hydrolase [Streptomyces griseoviridis]